VFPSNCGRNSDTSFRFRLSLMANASAQEKCIAGTKLRHDSEPAELVDLLGDSKREERSLDHAAGAALPHLR
jgi:hypothetical protein